MPTPPHAESTDSAQGQAFPEEFAVLIERARELMHRAYVPYSRYPVGAAGRVEDGRIVAGCNVENASFGLTLCAECGMVSELMATGGGKITEFVCVDGSENILVPCGRCRQLLAEHAAPTFTALTPNGVLTLDELMPQYFGATYLEEAHHDR